MFNVGEIVIVNETDTKAFIEEIIFTPNIEGVTRQQKEFGKYSLCAIEPTRKIERDGDWYIGDHLGDTITSTGQSMSVDDLLQYKKEKFGNHGGFANDIDIVIKNLGRNKGRNEK